ncbi:MAG: hypothetical protein ACLQME_11250 [Alphaproteobacteria bacterium]
MWLRAADRVRQRAEATALALTEGFPHWADATSGAWTCTKDGDWTGGALPGMLWLSRRLTGEKRFGVLARQWCERLKPRAKLETAFKGFGFYYGAALGEMLFGDNRAAAIALEAAESLKRQFDPRLGLIPLGKDAEEHGLTGKAFSSIDSLQATPLLHWAARVSGDGSYADCAARHTSRVLEIHCRSDGSIIQSSELDAQSGRVLRHFTHKGASDASIWGRAQAWGMLYSVMAHARQPHPAWIETGMAAADWWLRRVPENMVAFWDFDDPAIPDTERDTAATAIVCAALLKLGRLAPHAHQREHYREAAERTAHALVAGYLTPTGADDTRPPGMLIGGCFNKRRDARSQDSAANAELVFGSYFLLESLLVLAGALDAAAI